jgi:endoglucanase
LYRGISLKFLPEKDLSLLQSKNYALDFMVRCNNPKAQFEIRFVDNKTNDTATHSWRMSYLVTSKVVPFDNRWHHVHIPFSQMKETGAWDGTWSNPRGKFDWKSIGYLEFRNEQKALPSQTKIWFDNILVTNLDTAQVYDTTKIVEPPKTYSDIFNGNVKQLNVYPNPTKQQTTISYQLLNDAFVTISIYNTLGQKVCTLVEAKQSAGEYSINWQTADIPQGFYVCKLMTAEGILTAIILKE